MFSFFFLFFIFWQLQEPSDSALLAEQIKMFQVPNKILCKVVNVELKVKLKLFSFNFFKALVF
jgi:auxin response factor